MLHHFKVIRNSHSLRKHPFLLALRSWGRFARNVPIGEERGETDVFAGYNSHKWSFCTPMNQTRQLIEINSEK